MILSKNFELAEFSHSATATAKGIKNDIPEAYVPNIQSLVSNVLQPLRDYMGSSIPVISGYRSFELNNAVGGVPTSHHRTGQAADIVPSDLEKAFEYIKNNLPFTQLIWYKSKNFLHVSYVASNLKKQVLFS